MGPVSTPPAPPTDRYAWIRHAVDRGIHRYQMVPTAELRQLWAEHERTGRWTAAVTAAAAGGDDALALLLAEAEPHVVDEVLAVAEAVSAVARHDIIRRHATEAGGRNTTDDQDDTEEDR